METIKTLDQAIEAAFRSPVENHVVHPQMIVSRLETWTTEEQRSELDWDDVLVEAKSTSETIADYYSRPSHQGELEQEINQYGEPYWQPWMVWFLRHLGIYVEDCHGGWRVDTGEWKPIWIDDLKWEAPYSDRPCRSGDCAYLDADQPVPTDFRGTGIRLS